MQYEVKLTTMAKYAPHLISTEFSNLVERIKLIEIDLIVLASKFDHGSSSYDVSKRIRDESNGDRKCVNYKRSKSGDSSFEIPSGNIGDDISLRIKGNPLSSHKESVVLGLLRIREPQKHKILKAAPALAKA
ncbi:hypothetical protein IEQ34_003076 [Dendrobium chrysotoxum]|uniref:Uncharacterized protein n=1 Tax=Dendrobium chrysotoxum TaxID=161865 RepID=A0AAV7HJ01_DENCH|nr:hypothetical protein IEQ34_003076 [Dendrobium chrysotoxum]